MNRVIVRAGNAFENLNSGKQANGGGMISEALAWLKVFESFRRSSLEFIVDVAGQVTWVGGT